MFGATTSSDNVQLYSLLVHLRSTISKKGLMKLGGAPICLIIVLAIFRRAYYEMVSKCHFLPALMAACCLWRHLSLRNSITRFYIVFGVACFALSSTMQWIRVLWRNLIFSQAR